MASKDYIKLVNDSAKVALRKNQKSLDISILYLYSNAGQDLVKKFNRSRDGSATRAYYADYIRSLHSSMTELITKHGLSTAMIPSDMQNLLLKEEFKSAGLTGVDFKNHFGKIPYDILHDFEGGNIYKDGKGLSDRIWQAAIKSGASIQNKISIAMSQQMGAIEMSKMLEAYVDPMVRLNWSVKKQKEIFGPGYQAWNGNLEYNALRLARTTNTHMFTQALKKSSSKNPFVEGLKWHTSPQHMARMHGHTDSCDDNESQNAYGLGPGVFPIDKCPLDHPNGLCFQTTYFAKTLDEIGDELKSWVNGGDNTKMDKWSVENPDLFGVIIPKIKPAVVDIIKTKAKTVDTKKPAEVKPVEPKKTTTKPAKVPDIKIDESQVVVSERHEQEAINKLLEKVGTNINFVEERFLRYNTDKSTQIRELLGNFDRRMDTKFKKLSNLIFGKDGFVEMSVPEFNEPDGAYYTPGSRKIFFNIVKDAKNTCGKYNTFFHEFGHYVDDLGTKAGGQYGKISNNYHYVEAIKKDYEVLVEKFKKEAEGKSLGWEGRLGSELRKLDDNAAGVHDAISGLSLNTVRVNWMHRTDYWTRGSQYQEVASETFANMTAAMANPKAYEHFKKYFPTALEEYEKLLDKTMNSIVKKKNGRKVQNEAKKIAVQEAKRLAGAKLTK